MNRFQQALDELGNTLRDIEVERLALNEQEETVKSAIIALERLVVLESNVACPKCNSAVTGDGTSSTGERRYRCKKCKHRFEENPSICVHCKKPKHRGFCSKKNQTAPESKKDTIYTCTKCGEPRSLGSAGLCGKCYKARAEESKSKSASVAQRTDTAPSLRIKDALVEKEQQGREASNKLKEFKQQVRRPIALEKPSDCGKCVTKIIDGKLFLVSQPDCPMHGTGLEAIQEGRDRKGDPMFIKASQR